MVVAHHDDPAADKTGPLTLKQHSSFQVLSVCMPRAWNAHTKDRLYLSPWTPLVLYKKLNYDAIPLNKARLFWFFFQWLSGPEPSNTQLF